MTAGPVHYGHYGHVCCEPARYSRRRRNRVFDPDGIGVLTPQETATGRPPQRGQWRFLLRPVYRPVHSKYMPGRDRYRHVDPEQCRRVLDRI